MQRVCSRFMIPGLIVVLSLVSAVTVLGQAAPVALGLGQPALVTLAAGETRSFSYAPAQTASVTLQAIGDVAAPTLTVLQDGEVVAAETNSAGAFTITLTALLHPGLAYTLELSSVNAAAGTLVLVILSETPVPAVTLTAGEPLSGQVDAANPQALYRFRALAEPIYLYLDVSGLVETGATFQITNASTGRLVGMLGPETTGGRFRLPAGSSTFEVAAAFSTLTEADSYTICFTAISAGGCGAGQSALDVIATVEAPPDATALPACTVTPEAASGANIRQSASTSTILLGVLPGGQTAEVLGVSPDDTFYNIRYSNLNGWVARSVVNPSGDCSGLPVVQPPLFIVPPTATPIPPTATFTPVPPTATPSGPCLITVTAEFLVYTQPIAQPDYIQDEVGPGYQLVPVGRLADNSWWQTNYFSAWVETSNFGPRAQVSGNCSALPIVSP